LCNLTADPSAWTAEAGTLLGWLALLAAGAAPALRRFQQRQPVSWDAAALGSLAGIGLLACTVERVWSGWGYHVLMLGAAVAALLWSLAPLLVYLVQKHVQSLPFVGRIVNPAAGEAGLTIRATAREVTMPVGCISFVAVLLAVQAAWVREHYAWSAAAVILASAAGAVLAAQRRSEGIAFLAGLGANLAASLTVCHVYQNVSFSDWWVPFAKANIVTTSLVALLWLWLRQRLEGWRERGLLRGLLTVQCALGLAGNTLLLLVPLVRLFVEPGSTLPPPLVEMGYGGGWVALLLAAAAAFWHLDRVLPRWRIHVLGLLGVEAGILVACFAGPWDTGNWLSFHVLTGAWCLLGLAVVAAGTVAHSFRLTGLAGADTTEPEARRFAGFFPAEVVCRWVEGIGPAILVLALRSDRSDPLWPYGSAAAVMIVSILIGALAMWLRRPVHVYVSGLLLNVVGILFWAAREPNSPASFLLTNALCLAIGSAFWSAVQLALRSWQRAGNEGPTALVHSPPFVTSFPHFAVLLGQGLLSVVIALGLTSDFSGADVRTANVLAWTTLAAVGLALGVCTWDRRARFPLAGLYGLGLATIGLVLHGLALTPQWLAWSTTLALAGYVALAGLFRRTSVWWEGLGRSLRIPPRAGGWLAGWFLPTQTVVAGIVVGLSVWICLDFATLGERLGGPGAVLLLVLAGVLLAGEWHAFAAQQALGNSPRQERAAKVWHPRWADGLRAGTLILGVVAVVETAWAGLGPTAPALWLHRNVLLMVALALMTLAYGVGLGRLLPGQNAWVEWGRRLGLVLGGLATLTLLVLLGQEFSLYDFTTGHTPMAGPAVVTVLAGLVILMVTAIRFAVTPGRDPLGLSERGRTLYVYAAEALLALAFVHVRLNVPDLFNGWGAPYWSFFVMGIAFAGVALSEWFERRKLPVLAVPLQRTGLFLPLLPLLGFWAGPHAPRLVSGAEPPVVDPAQLFVRYALLWFLASGLYAFMATTRRSFRFALLAALAANFGWWSLLVPHQDFSFLVHPQMWLIPLAVILLLAEQLNHDRLPRELALGLRYLGLCMVYVSSTADLFIAGVGKSVWLPIVLALLAVIGVLAGILLRVRAFLFLGVSFLFLDVCTMIWHAAVDRSHTWVLYVSGIVLGAAILALFAVFEKRRNDVLRLIEEIKGWD
jgi:hypothetical protein